MAQQQWAIENANLYTSLMSYTKHARHHNGKCHALKKKNKKTKNKQTKKTEGQAILAFLKVKEKVAQVFPTLWDSMDS